MGTPVSLFCLCNGCPVAYGSMVLNEEDVQVEGQTRGACICLAVAQKCLAFHTTPLGSLVKLSQKFMKNRGKEGTRKERIAGVGGRGGGGEVMEHEGEEKNELDDMRRQKER